jgi:hypothetical protein
MGLFGPSNPVFEMLQKDHKKVKDLFEQFEQAEDARRITHLSSHTEAARR